MGVCFEDEHKREAMSLQWESEGHMCVFTDLEAHLDVGSWKSYRSSLPLLES